MSRCRPQPVGGSSDHAMAGDRILQMVGLSDGDRGSRGGPRARPPRNKHLAKELEVMRLIAEGLKDDAVARRLGVSEVTVRRRIRRFRARVGATSRVQAAVEACRRNWL